MTASTVRPVSGRTVVLAARAARAGPGTGFNVAVGTHDGCGARRQAPGQKVEQQLRGLIGPLQVIEEHDQRLDPRLSQQHRGHLVEQLEAGGCGRGIDIGR